MSTFIKAVRLFIFVLIPKKGFILLVNTYFSGYFSIVTIPITFHLPLCVTEACRKVRRLKLPLMLQPCCLICSPLRRKTRIVHEVQSHVKLVELSTKNFYSRNVWVFFKFHALMIVVFQDHDGRYISLTTLSTSIFHVAWGTMGVFFC